MASLHKKTVEDYLIAIFTYIIYSFFAFVCVYPFYYILTHPPRPLPVPVQEQNL